MRHYSERALLTDLYEITMLQAYFSRGMDETAVFEFFVRQLPNERNFLMAAGLAQVVAYLTELRFQEEDLAWLHASGQFDAAFIDSLQHFRFTGDVDALQEGTVFFASWSSMGASRAENVQRARRRGRAASRHTVVTMRTACWRATRLHCSMTACTGTPRCNR